MADNSAEPSGRTVPAGSAQPSRPTGPSGSAVPSGRVPTLPAGRPDVLTSAIREFAVAHHGASAVVEYAGRRRGARILLTGSDGSFADAYAPGTDVARDVCRQAGVDLVNTWERDLLDEIRTQASVW